MVCHNFHQTHLESFVTESKEAYIDFVRTNKLIENKTFDKLFKGLDIEIKLRKIRTEQEFVARTHILSNRFCKNIKERGKQYEFAQKLDNILIPIVKEMKTQVKENLKHAAKLQKMIGHTLQRFRSVCGYGLSGVHMNFEIKMLQGGKDQKEIQCLIGKLMKNEAELKHKKIYELVTFVIIGKLPVLFVDKQLKLEILKKNGGQRASPSTQTVGIFFEIENEDGLYFSSCTHGADFTDAGVTFFMDNTEFEAQYWESVYEKPDEAPHDNEEKDLHTSNIEESLTGDESSVGPAAMDTSDDMNSETPESMEVDNTACGVTALFESNETKWDFDPSKSTPESSTADPDSQDLSKGLGKRNLLKGGLSDRRLTMKRSMSDQPTPSPRESLLKKERQSLRGTRDTRSPQYCSSFSRESSRSSTSGDSGISSLNSSRSSMMTAIDEDGKCPVPISSSTPKRPGCSRKGSGNNGGHIDFGIFKVKNDTKVRHLLQKTGYLLVEEMEDDIEEILYEKVRKYGVRTGVTHGQVVNLNFALKCTVSGETVWMKDMIVTEQHHDFNQVVQNARYNSEPLVLTQDVRVSHPLRASQGQSSSIGPLEGGSGAVGAVGGAEVIGKFVAPGDSGACITTLPSGDKVTAVAVHLYHYDSEANIYKKKLNYSVSCPLYPAVRKFEAERGKKLKILATPVPRGEQL